MSRRHTEHKKEMREEQLMYTRGSQSLNWQRRRSPTMDCGSRKRSGRTTERSDERKSRSERRHHRETEFSYRSKERERHHRYHDSSRRSKRIRRSDSPATSHRQEKDEQSKNGSAVGDYYNLDTDEPFDKERFHRETQEKLQKLRDSISKESKGPAPAKQTASGCCFANDGSFLDTFKKIQQEETNVAAPYIIAASMGAPAPPPLLSVGRRRGGKILKTGRVPKPKDATEKTVDPTDFWSVYQAEVDKYKTSGCDTEDGTRKLVM
ncbi:uncharacterized protein LOC117579491 [Drosophila guanche]|uniref:Blast:Uncharacterized protein C19orf43 homolog n=1 Tax=Drosophila guanche TaxID=7266 RepID=A0A3B0J9N0_DROGU|nr:uncharacterized protein LOC117579491 [Drosophila guanche]SPP76662.1 blast:Uncharacterized protein C19orf43 homolog [Drosophila guanche]